MSINLEIKVKVNDIEVAKQIARSLPAIYMGELHQIDTYFSVPQGRLKLREIKDTSAELIFYKREDQPTQKKSHFEIYRTSEPQQLKVLLRSAFGVRTIVEKTRSLFLFGQTRIHLDDVTGLGYYLEFEVPIQDGSDGKDTMDRLISHFCISPKDYISVSYADLLVGV